MLVHLSIPQLAPRDQRTTFGSLRSHSAMHRVQCLGIELRLSGLGKQVFLLAEAPLCPSTSMRLTDQLDWLVSKLWGSICLCMAAVPRVLGLYLSVRILTLELPVFYSRNHHLSLGRLQNRKSRVQDTLLKAHGYGFLTHQLISFAIGIRP